MAPSTLLIHALAMVVQLQTLAREVKGWCNSVQMWLPVANLDQIEVKVSRWRIMDMSSSVAFQRQFPSWKGVVFVLGELVALSSDGRGSPFSAHQICTNLHLSILEKSHLDCFSQLTSHCHKSGYFKYCSTSMLMMAMELYELRKGFPTCLPITTNLGTSKYCWHFHDPDGHGII